MSEKYKVLLHDNPNFITLTVVGWVDLFIRPVYTQILDESFRYCMKSKGLLAPAGIAAAAGGIAGASEFKANKRALAKQQFENRKQLEAMAELANDNLSGNMTSPEQLASNANAKWGPGEIQIGGLEHRFGVGKSPFTIVEKSLISGGEFITFSSGSTEIFANGNAPLLMRGQSIKSSGLTLGAELATSVGLFSKTKGTIYLDQPLKGTNISEVFSTTKTIHSKTFGSVIKYTKIQGFDSNGTLLWHANTKGTCLCASLGGYRYPFNLK